MEANVHVVYGKSNPFGSLSNSNALDELKSAIALWEAKASGREGIAISHNTSRLKVSLKLDYNANKAKDHFQSALRDYGLMVERVCE